jgi:hypothetical protein
VSAGDDSIFVYLMPGWMTLSGAQDAVLELSGDDDAFMLMWSDYDHREPVLGWAGKALAYDALVSK